LGNSKLNKPLEPMGAKHLFSRLVLSRTLTYFFI
jgi:hypothetical protein